MASRKVDGQTHQMSRMSDRDRNSDPKAATTPATFLAELREDVKVTLESFTSIVHKLLGELDRLQASVRDMGRDITTPSQPELNNRYCSGSPFQDYDVDTRMFRKMIMSEVKPLQKFEAACKTICDELDRLKDSGVNEKQTPGDAQIVDAEEKLRQLLHKIRSSNLPFQEVVWNMAKSQCRSVVAVYHRVAYYESRSKDENGHTVLRLIPKQVNAQNGQKCQQDSTSEELTKKAVVVDVVCEDGQQWVKVSTSTPERLILDFARLGLDLADLEEEEKESAESESYSVQQEENENEIELIKIAKNATRAASTVRVNYRHPEVCLKIPNIKEGQAAEIDWILKKVRRTGATVECGEPKTDATSNTESWEECASRMLPSPFPRTTDTLNVDCSALIAIISQISNRRLEAKKGFQRIILQQIENERTRYVLKTRLWPVCGSRKLVCTFEAKTRILGIVEILGNEEEKERTKLILSEDCKDANGKPLTREDRIARYQELCSHQVPLDWQIPIRAIDGKASVEDALATGRFPPLAHIVAQELNELNRSIFMTGWLLGITTITSNRVTVRQIETIIQNNRRDIVDDDVLGPMCWICDTSRSLLSKGQ